jgi:threonine/homoserine/homoserine lactone efflux protein
LDALLTAYVSFTAILVLTPGATTAVVVRNALAGGRAGGLAAATGAAIGNTSHAALAGLGLALIFARYPAALTTLRVSGAGYLAWLGLRSTYRVLKHPDGGLRRQGLLVNLLNPAIATFYLVVLPSFIPPGSPGWYFAALAAVHIVMAFLCHGVWALALDRVRRLFGFPLARRLLECATGLALIALALRILLNP